MKRFDAYLFNEMSKTERAQFETDIGSDDVLEQEFEEHRNFLSTFAEGVEYKEITKKLRSIHTSLYEPRQNFFTSRQFLIPVGIAAAFVLLVLTINPFVFQGNLSADNKSGDSPNNYSSATDTASYAPDAAAVEPASADEAMNNLLPAPAADLQAPIKEESAGNAFLISDQGYFLTAATLVDHDGLITLQHYNIGSFEAALVYTDSLAGFALLRCHPDITRYLKLPVPYHPVQRGIKEEQDLYSFFYKNSKPVLEKAVVVAIDTAAGPDFKIKMSDKRHLDGAPVFNRQHELAGIVVPDNSGYSVTNAIDYRYVQGILDDLYEQGLIPDLTERRAGRTKLYSDPQKRISPFIFEVHP